MSLAEAKIEQPGVLSESALGLGGRFAAGFSDDYGKYKMLRESGYAPENIVKLRNGDWGARVYREDGTTAIKPIDPKGFKFGDMLGDIAESFGKGITALGGTAGIAGGTLVAGPGGGVLGAGAGQAAGEYARQKIGEFLGVREGLDKGEIALEGGLGLAGGAIGLGASKALSRFASPAATQNIDDVFKNKTVYNALKNLSKDQIDELSDMPISNIKNLLGQVDDRLATSTARIEDFYGIDDDVAAHLIKSAKNGRIIDTSIKAGKASDAEIANRVLEIRNSADKLKTYLGKEYSNALSKVDKSKVIDTGEIKSFIKNIIDDTPEIERFVKKAGLNKNTLTIDDLLNAKSKINDTAIMKKHWLATSQGKPEFASEAGINLERLDGLIRAKLNTVDELAAANSMYGESIDSINKINALMTNTRGERNILKMKNLEGAHLRVGEPLKEFEAVILKHGKKAGVNPIYDKIMDNIVQREFGTAQTKLSTSSPIVRATREIPVLQGVVDNLSTPWALAKSIKFGANKTIALKQLAARIKSLPVAKQLVELEKLVGKEAAPIVAGQLGLTGGSKSLNSILFRE